MADDQKPVLFGALDYKTLGLGLAFVLSSFGWYISPEHRRTDDEHDKRQWAVIYQHTQDIAGNARSIAIVQERVEQCRAEARELKAEIRELRAERERVRR